MGATVVTSGDAAPVLKLGEHVLDLVTLPVENFIVSDGFLAAPSWRNAGLDTPVNKRLAEPVAVVAPVGDERFGLRQGIEDQPRALVIAHLAFGEEHDERLSHAVADDMELGVQPAFRADTAGKPWAAISDFETGRPLGWVFRKFVGCF